MITYELHPLATIFPQITGEAFDELVADIRANGLREAITLFEGQILDGRNRASACHAAEVEPRFEDWKPSHDGDTPQAFVISRNLARRHLNDGQRAAVAARLANHPGANAKGTPKRAHMREGKPAGGGKDDGNVTMADAARMLNVTQGQVERARGVIKHGSPGIIAKVDAGEMKISTAAEAVKQSRIADPKSPGRTGVTNYEITAEPLHPLVEECFDWIEKLYDREREFKALARKHKVDIMNELAMLLGVDIGQMKTSKKLSSDAA